MTPLDESGVGKMIRVIRNKQVLLDSDLAILYGVETKRINEQVKRNIERFPEKFCFQLNSDEVESVKSQIATSRGAGFFAGQNGGRRKNPYAFTEQGVAMLSGILHSKIAISVSIAIMEAFVAMRHFLMNNGGMVQRLANVESKVIDQDARLLNHEHKLDSLFEAMDRGELKTKGVSVTIYTYDKSKIFELDLQKYNAQYADCPIEILPNTNTHDRFLFIDETSYHFGASLKDLGKKTFFCSKEDFTLEEVLKETQNGRPFSI